ncbi:MAG: Ig domain-containing protein [Abditibacteriota bacterium]|nr:Ig domain-containing protein [Abditibacteriota bacterium]
MSKFKLGAFAAAALALLAIAAWAVTWNGATTIFSSQTREDEYYTSSKANQNSLLISTAGTVTLNDTITDKTGDSSSGDDCNFYGINSGIMCKGGGVTYINGGSVTTGATGANGIFSYGGNSGMNGAAGDGTTVIVTDTVITTTGDSSGGIMTTGGGITEAYDLYISTSGTSSAPIRTDRGGGTVTVRGGTYESTGAGSPAIYSTAAVSVENANLATSGSEAVVIEGANSVYLSECYVDGNNSRLNGQSTTYDNVKLYQSMSGDAASGTAVFNMYGGSMICRKGNMFHVTNTDAVIDLQEVSLVNSSDNVLLDVSADAWGTSGKNGGAVTLNATDQNLEGEIRVDSISSLTMTMTGDTSFSGMINTSGKQGTVKVVMDEDTIWKLAGDSYISSLSKDDDALIDLNGYSLYVNGKPYEPPSVAVTGVSLNKTSVKLSVGDTYRLTAAVTPSGATDQSVTWSSSDKTVAKVSSAGKITAVSAGTCYITVKTVDGGFTAKCKVTVKAASVPVTGVTLSDADIKLKKGESATLTATVSPSDATDKNVTWSSDDASVATVSSDGVVTAVGAGTVKVRVKTRDGGFTAKCKVRVTVPVTGVTLNKKDLTLTKGASETLTATIAPSDATNTNVSWKSYDESVATISADGTVTAVGGGKTKVRVKTKDGGFTAYCWIRVKVPVTGVTLDKTSLTISKGSSAALTATVAPSDATKKDLKWKSYDTSIATVDANGRVKGVAKGTTTIRVQTKDGDYRAKCKVTVN